MLGTRFCGLRIARRILRGEMALEFGGSSKKLLASIAIPLIDHAGGVLSAFRVRTPEASTRQGI